MNFKLKEITEDNLVDFLLNPFEKSAKFGDKVIQKYAVNDKLDDILVLPNNEKAFHRAGIVSYKTKDIILSISDVLETKLVKSKPFILRTTAIFKIMDLTNKRLDDYKKSNLEKIKENDLYKRLYRCLKDKYFEQLVFQELGTTNVNFNIGSLTDRDIDIFLSGLKLTDLADILSGNIKDVDALIHKITKSPNFIEAEIIQPELTREAKEYVKKGVFTKREQILIDYLAKTKTSGAQKFTVKTIQGTTAYCKNEVNSQGQVYSSDNLLFSSDIRDIDTVTYNGKVIYKRSIY